MHIRAHKTLFKLQIMQMHEITNSSTDLYLRELTKTKVNKNKNSNALKKKRGWNSLNEAWKFRRYWFLASSTWRGIIFCPKRLEPGVSFLTVSVRSSWNIMSSFWHFSPKANWVLQKLVERVTVRECTLRSPATALRFVLPRRRRRCEARLAAEEDRDFRVTVCTRRLRWNHLDARGTAQENNDIYVADADMYGKYRQTK